MPFQFILPDIGEGVVEGEIVRWHVKPGDQVKEDQTLVEVMTDKATVQIPSPKTGTVGKLHFKEGEIAKVGKALVDIEVGDSAPAKAAPVAVEKSMEKPVEKAAPIVAAASANEEAEPLVASSGDREVLATPIVRKLAREEGVELSKITGTGPNGRITREDVLSFAHGGQVLSFQAPRKESREAPQVAAQAGRAQGGEEKWRPPPPRETPVSREAGRGDSQRDFAREQREFASSSNNQRAPQQPQAQQPQTQQPQAQQPLAQRPQQSQHQQQPPRQQQQPQAQQQKPQAPAPQAPSPQRAAGDQRVPIRGLRKRISERMHLSKSTAAHFTYVEEFDLTDLVAMRDKLKPRYKAEGITLNYLPFIVKAAVLALKKFPNINANIDDQANELIVRGDYNIGFATQTDDGLVVPVVRDVGSKSIAAVAREIEQLSAKVRARTATQQELTGGTFTITSLGQLGGVLATPIINYPEVAILGVHAIRKKPAVVNDQIVIRQMANFAASFDHRLIDGYIGAQFIAELKRYLETPDLLFMELA